MNENENTNLWDAAKAVFRGKFVTMNAYIKKERSQINDLNSTLRHWKRRANYT